MTKKTKKPSCTCPRPDIHKALDTAGGATELTHKMCINADQQAKVWCVILDIDYEGCSEPVAAFTNPEPAWVMAESLNRREKTKYQRYDVVQVDLGIGMLMGYNYGM